MARLSRSSACFWLAMTLAACPVLLLGLGYRLLELDLRVGRLVELPGQGGRHVTPATPHEVQHVLIVRT